MYLPTETRAGVSFRTEAILLKFLPRHRFSGQRVGGERAALRHRLAFFSSLA